MPSQALRRGSGPHRPPTATRSPMGAEERCCSTPQAWVWVQVLAALALAGDPDGLRCLPTAIGHYLTSERLEVVP